MGALRTFLGDIYLSRGWPRRALEHYDLVLALAPGDRGALRSRIKAKMALRDYRGASEDRAMLEVLYPDVPDLAALDRDWDAAHDWAPSVSANYESSDGDTFASESYDYGGRVYGPLLRERWRFLGDYRTHVGEFLEGDEELQQISVGGDYRGADLDSELTLMFTEGTVDDVSVSGRVGWRLDEHWRLGVEGESFSRQTPLRAIRNGVDAWHVAADGGYRFSESADLRCRVIAMDFSDGNLRTEGQVGCFWRPYVFHRFVLDTDLALYAAHNERVDGSYFSPKSSVSLPLTIKPQHMLWRRYRTALWQQLALEVGPVQQHDYDTELNWSVSYEHRWIRRPRFELVYGIGHASRVYDGEREEAWFLRVSL